MRSADRKGSGEQALPTALVNYLLNQILMTTLHVKQLSFARIYSVASRRFAHGCVCVCVQSRSEAQALLVAAAKVKAIN